MMTVHEVSKITGVSVRTLQYYDKIGLLHPAGYSDAGYRLYDDASLEILQQILLFRELEFPLKEIKEIVATSEFDRDRVLEQQIALLTLKKEHLEKLIRYAREIQKKGVSKTDFKAFDTHEIDEYTEVARATWGDTVEYGRFEERYRQYTAEQKAKINEKINWMLTSFYKVMDKDPASIEVQKLVEIHKELISVHFYECTNEILMNVGKVYGSKGDFAKRMDSRVGAGVADYISKAIEIYCKNINDNNNVTDK